MRYIRRPEAARLFGRGTAAQAKADREGRSGLTPIRVARTVVVYDESEVHAALKALGTRQAEPPIPPHRTAGPGREPVTGSKTKGAA
jgi:hypothetical protein